MPLNRIKHKLERLFADINFKNECKGGIASAIVTLPIAIAFGHTSGLGAEAGLYSAIIIGIVGSLFGGTPTQISSPVGVVVVYTIYVINQHLALSTESLSAAQSSAAIFSHALPFIFYTFMIAGIFQILFGVLKLGDYISYIPHPVISGFSSGIGLLIIILQFKDLFGFSLDSHHQYHINDLLSTSNFIKLEHTLIILTTTLLILVFWPKLIKSIPATLIALVAVSTIPYLFNWENFRTIGTLKNVNFEIDFSFISAFESTERLQLTVILGFTLALINSINTLLTSVAADHISGDTHQSNKELIGQGIGNAVVSFFGGIPGGGAIACTSVNIHYGARSRISGIICSLILVLIMIFGVTFLAKIPISVLSSMLVYVGYLIIDKKSIRAITKMPWMDSLIMVLVVILTTIGELFYAVILGISLSSIYFMKRMADIVEIETEEARTTQLINNLINSFENTEIFKENVLIKTIKGPMFFGFASRFSKSLQSLSQKQSIVFNLSSVSFIDQSGLFTLQRELKKLHTRGISTYLTEPNPKIRQFLIRTNVIGAIVPVQNVFSTLEECIMTLQETTFGRDDETIYIPPAFTPNNDGINDVWKIFNIDKFPNCRVAIADKNNTTVFESIGYQKPWDGCQNQLPLPSEQYKYEIQLDQNDASILRGFVTILR